MTFTKGSNSTGRGRNRAFAPEGEFTPREAVVRTQLILVFATAIVVSLAASSSSARATSVARASGLRGDLVTRQAAQAEAAASARRRERDVTRTEATARQLERLAQAELAT